MSLTLYVKQAAIQLVGRETLDKVIKVYETAFPGWAMSAEVSFVGTEEIRSLNREHRRIDEATDVLSFPLYPNTESVRIASLLQGALLGSIVICPEKAEKYGETLVQLIHHGLLHLLGFDHETDSTSWSREEKRILEVFQKNGLEIPGVPNEAVQLP